MCGQTTGGCCCDLLDDRIQISGPFSSYSLETARESIFYSNKKYLCRTVAVIDCHFGSIAYSALSLGTLPLQPHIRPVVLGGYAGAFSAPRMRLRRNFSLSFQKFMVVAALWMHVKLARLTFYHRKICGYCDIEIASQGNWRTDYIDCSECQPLQ